MFLSIQRSLLLSLSLAMSGSVMVVRAQDSVLDATATAVNPEPVSAVSAAGGQVEEVAAAVRSSPLVETPIATGESIAPASAGEPASLPEPRKSDAASLIAPDSEGQMQREAIIKSHDATGALDVGWAYFDQKQWETSRQWFDRALDFDPKSSRAAEGLIMSTYREGNAKAAYEVAQAHAGLVPEGQAIVVKAVATTAQQLVSDGEVEKAESLISGFPETEAPIAEIRKAIASRRMESAVARQEYEEARTIAKANDIDTAVVARDEAADLLQQAAEARDSGQHRASLDLVDQAEKVAPLERSGRRLKAWSLYRNRDFDDSAKMFEELYREGKDRDSAEGLVNSLQQSGKTDSLAKLSKELGGPLASASEPVLLAANRAEEERLRRQSEQQRELLAQAERERQMAAADDQAGQDAMAARASAGSGGMTTTVAAASAMTFSGDPIDRTRREIPESSRINGGVGVQTTTRDGGLDKLRVTHMPTVETTLVFGTGGNQSLTLGVHALSLDGGGFRSGRLVGSADSTLDPRPFVTETDTLIEPTLAYRLEKGERAFFAEIGTTPLGADISAKPVGAIGVEWQGERAAAGLQGFSESVKESMLSYTGMTDPYTGESWGRVVKTGVRADGAIDLGDNWGAHGLFEFSKLEGEGVVDNSSVSGDIGLSYQLDVPGFEYVAIGPNFHFEAYDKNLSQFTNGHGGYFSPDQLYQGMLGASFMTETGRSWLAEGFVGVGAQSNDQAAAPVLANSPDGRFYEASSDSSAIFTARMQALFELNPQWRLGAQAGYAKTAAYEDFAVSLYMSFLFDGHSGLDATDLKRGQ